MGFQFPVIRLELDRMRQGIIFGLNSYNQDVMNYVDAELKKIVENFDYTAIVTEAANKAITEAIQKSVTAYFSYGEGRDAIDSAVQETLSLMLEKEKRLRKK